MTYDEIISKLEAEASKAGLFAPLIQTGIDALKDNKEFFRTVGEETMKNFLELVTTKKHDQAKEFFIKNFAKASDLIDGMKKGADAIRNAPADLETVFDAVWDKLTGVFSQFVIKLILEILKKG